MAQIHKNGYQFSAYSGVYRFASCARQLQEILALHPQSVLEVGIGENVVGQYLKTNTDIEYISADFAKDLSPDVIADVCALPFRDEQFDLSCAFEVLEHLPFEDFNTALGELARVSKKYVLISLPHFGPAVKFLLKLPFLPEWHFAFKIPFPRVHIFNGQHYWEIGKRGYSVSRIREILCRRFIICGEFIPFENQYHHFFVLEKK